MAVLVFSTRNSTITDAAWHVGKGGLQAVSRGSRSIGICCAMTAVWIWKSVENANHFEFFDPNSGLSRYRSKVEFRTGVQDMIEYYADQLGAPMRWDIGRV